MGENSAFIREKVCSNLNILGVAFDRQRNDEVNQGIREIHSPESKIKLLVVPTNEELQIVNETEKLLA